jgi:16S rRNA (cytosine1407-C5)-methyltransferase
VVANDIASSRIKTLAHNVNLGGLYNTAITRFNGFAFGKNVPEMFDHVLVDAPCSGE